MSVRDRMFPLLESVAARVLSCASAWSPPSRAGAEWEGVAFHVGASGARICASISVTEEVVSRGLVDEEVLLPGHEHEKEVRLLIRTSYPLWQSSSCRFTAEEVGAGVPEYVGAWVETCASEFGDALYELVSAFFLAGASRDDVVLCVDEAVARGVIES